MIKNIKPVLTILLFLIFTGFAQTTGTIKGVVKDATTGDPLQEALITVAGTYLGDVSDFHGEFEIRNVPPGKHLLLVSLLGYQKMELGVNVQAGEITQVSIQMKQKPIAVEEIIVTATRENISPQVEVYSREVQEESPKDIGEFFRKVNGGGAVKKGGFAMDPVLRSFKYDELNVQYDGGIRAWGGCPNRMDPPTSHIQSEDLEKIEIIKGPFTVRFGQTMGGVVNLVMKKPEPGQEFQLHVSGETGYETNGESKRARLSFTGGVKNFDFYLGGGTKDYGNYTTGAGLEVPSSFRVNDYSVKVGFTPRPDHRFQVSWRQSFARDVNYPALPMDARKDDTNILALDYSGRNLSSKIVSLAAKIYKTDVSHLMDNLDRPNYSIVHAVTDVTADTYGGRLELGLNMWNKSLWYLGADYYRLHKDGNRSRDVYFNVCTQMPVNPPMHFNDYVWQNSSISDAGFFSEIRHSLTNRLTIIAGARLDLISSRIKDPSTQFLQEYGDISEFNETNFSGTVSFQYTLSKSTLLSLSAGRGTRTADLTERYINHLTVGRDAYEYFGNPNLKSEANNQVELGIVHSREKLSLRGNIYYSLINNYIFARVDTGLHRLFMPCVPPQYTKRFRNIDEATQVGFELSFNGKIGGGFSYRGNAFYTRGENVDLNEPLPEIPPLEGNLVLRYFNVNHRFWGEIGGRFVADQNRISTTFGETKTPGFAVYNAEAGVQIGKYLQFSFNVNNIFDRNYYEHLSRKYKNMPDSYLLYEPGRNFAFNLKVKY